MAFDQFTPSQLLQIFEKVYTPQNVFGNLFFNNPVPMTEEKAELDIVKGGQSIAPFVKRYNFSGAKVVEREGYITADFSPEHISLRRVLKIDDLQKRMAGENLYSPMSPEERAIALMTKDYVELDNMIARREEVMRAQALFTGKVTMVIDGATVEVDMSQTHLEALTGTSKWNDAASNPFYDLDRWTEIIQQDSGLNPDIAIMAPDVSRAVMNNEKLMKQLDNRNMYVGSIAPEVMKANGLTYIGTHSLTGLDLYRHAGRYRDTDGTLKSYCPSGKVLLGSRQARTSQFYGRITFVKDPITYNTPRVSRDFIDENANIRYLEVNSRPLPVIHDIDAFFVGTVL